MKKALFVGISLIVAVLVPWRANAVQMTISYEDKEQPPYYMGNTDAVLADKPGVAVEMAQMLEKRIDGLTVTLRRTPWKRCTTELGTNAVDGIFNASYKKERLSLGWYPTTDNSQEGPVDESRRIVTIAYSLYKLKGTEIGWKDNKFTEFTGKIGAPSGYSIVDDLKAKGLDVEEAPSTEMNLKKLLIQRVAAVALQDVTGDNFLKSNPEQFGKIEKVTPPLETKTYYLMLSHQFVEQNPQLAQKIWDTLREIREEKFDEIAAKYAVN